MELVGENRDHRSSKSSPRKQHCRSQGPVDCVHMTKHGDPYLLVLVGQILVLTGNNGAFPNGKCTISPTTVRPNPYSLAISCRAQFLHIFQDGSILAMRGSFKEEVVRWCMLQLGQGVAIA